MESPAQGTRTPATFAIEQCAAAFNVYAAGQTERVRLLTWEAFKTGFIAGMQCAVEIRNSSQPNHE